MPNPTEPAGRGDEEAAIDRWTRKIPCVQFGNTWYVPADEVHDTISRLLLAERQDAAVKALEPIRKELSSRGFCGDGGLPAMVGRALDEAGPKYARELTDIIRAVSNLCGNAEGTLPERVKALCMDAAVKALERAAGIADSEYKASGDMIRALADRVRNGEETP